MIRLHHLALKVTDLKIAAEFYGNGLGLPFLCTQTNVDGEPRSHWYDLKGVILMIEEENLPQNHATSKPIIAFEIKEEDKESWVKRLKVNKISILKQTSHTLYFQDPFGNQLALSHYPHP